MGAVRTTTSCRSWTFVAAAAFAAPLVAAPFFPVSVRWRAPLPSAPSAPAAEGRGQLFIPLRAGRLVALARASGRERWSIALESPWRPVYGDGLLFVAARGEIVALDAQNGAPRWRLSAGALAASPAWREGWLVAGLEDGEILAIRASDGGLLWRRRAGRLSAAPTIDGDRLFLPFADGRVTAATLADGRERWTRSLRGAPGRILADDERLFVGARDNFFYCLDAADGDIRWSWRTGADVIGPAALDAERVYFVSLDNVLRALDRANGTQRWRRPLPLRPLDGPQYADGRLVVSGLSPQVLTFRADDGAAAGEWMAPAELAVPIVVLTGEDGLRLVAIPNAISGEWTAIGVGAAADPPIEPLSVVPGTPLAPWIPRAPPGS